VQPNLPQLVAEALSIAQEAREKSSEDELQQLQSHWESNVIKIGVIGTTNSGKSTTINALLNGKYLPASFGSTTARVVCIKCDPSATQCKLSDSKLELLAEGKEEIHKVLRKLNKEQRDAGLKASCQSMLHICVSQSLNFKAHLFDTPGMSESKMAALYKDAKDTLDQVDGVFIVLSVDSMVNRETTELIQDLRSCYPKLLDPNFPGRAVVLMNKYDQLFKQDEDEVTETKEEISTTLNLPPEDILYYSAQMGLESRLLKSNPASLTKRQFTGKLSLELGKENEQFEEEIEKCSDYNVENIRTLAGIHERISRIKEVEQRIDSFLPCKTVAVLNKLIERLNTTDRLSWRVEKLKHQLDQIVSN